MKVDASPKSHPNAYVALSSGGVTAFIVREAKFRLGWDISAEEAGYIVAAVVTIFQFGSRWVGGRKTA